MRSFVAWRAREEAQHSDQQSRLVSPSSDAGEVRRSGRGWPLQSTYQVSNQGAQVKLVRRCPLAPRQSDTRQARRVKTRATRPEPGLVEFTSVETRDPQLWSNLLWNHDISRGWWRFLWGRWALCHWHYLELGKDICGSSAWCVEGKKNKHALWVKESTWWMITVIIVSSADCFQGYLSEMLIRISQKSKVTPSNCLFCPNNSPKPLKTFFYYHKWQ